MTNPSLNSRARAHPSWSRKCTPVAGFLAPLALHAKALAGVTIPGEQNPHHAEAIATAARSVGIRGSTAPSVETALREFYGHGSDGRVLICGSLHLAGTVLAENS